MQQLQRAIEDETMDNLLRCNLRRETLEAQAIECKKYIEMFLNMPMSEVSCMHTACTMLMKGIDQYRELHISKTTAAKALLAGKPIVSPYDFSVCDVWLDKWISTHKCPEIVQESFTTNVIVKYRRGGYKYQEIIKQRLVEKQDIMEAILAKVREKYPSLGEPYVCDLKECWEGVDEWSYGCHINADCFDNIREKSGEGTEHVPFTWYVTRLNHK